MRLKRTTVDGVTRYVAEGESFRYTAQRNGKAWSLTIAKLRTVAGIRVDVAGPAHKVASHDTLTLCQSVAAEFEALGDDYRSADHGHRERYTEAVQRAYCPADAAPEQEDEESDMPKKGQRQPWRLTFQYGTQAKASNVAFDSQADAEGRAAEILATAPLRGTTVALTITNRDTGESYNYPKGENIMAESNGTNTDINTDEGRKILDQIQANIERAGSLTDAEALEALGKETETLISSLSGKGSIKAKTEWRAAWKSAATEATERMTTSAEVATVDERTYAEFEGVSELVTMGAERVAEGVRLHLKTSDLAKEIASIGLDIVRRLPNKDGDPDLMIDSNRAKQAMKDLYESAGKGFERTFENVQALKKLQRSVQYYRTDIRADYLRSLDGDGAEAAAERALFGRLLEAKPEDTPVSEYLAKHYDTALKGKAAIEREKWQAKNAITSGNGNSDSDDSDSDDSDSDSDSKPEATPDERVREIVKRLRADVGKAKPEDFEKATDETKESVRKELEELYDAVKKMITATL